MSTTLKVILVLWVLLGIYVNLFVGNIIPVVNLLAMIDSLKYGSLILLGIGIIEILAIFTIKKYDGFNGDFNVEIPWDMAIHPIVSLILIMFIVETSIPLLVGYNMTSSLYSMIFCLKAYQMYIVLSNVCLLSAIKWHADDKESKQKTIRSYLSVTNKNN